MLVPNTSCIQSIMTTPIAANKTFFDELAENPRVHSELTSRNNF
jgi:hypothetical protein